MRLGYNRITRKVLTLSAEIQFLFFHAITGEAILTPVNLLTSFTVIIVIFSSRQVHSKRLRYVEVNTYLRNSSLTIPIY